MSANAMSDNDELQQIAHLRREYTKGGLRRQDLPAEPLVLFERWLKQACEAKLADPTAMVVATVDENGQPYQRIVLLKHYDEKGLVFYTNLGSRKAHHLENNPRISLLFPWLAQGGRRLTAVYRGGQHCPAGDCHCRKRLCGT